ncbi:Gfo/Idh/MocA family protein [Microbulbifer sp. 2205BS26-8]|uniref:Gfo/Idh/MocA family protein n=1 Tax=Microbulbifer sp. 2205BS26-8 TaxID=3064386 RepID=UPI00273DEA3F|nr:Gfo/Idh/MocA family oxidoreductase [Microbulbifer sp. 2205BS26-8]MDP5210769.1 Gfo/Idh/MocA family oxidoreductase [Microbulbifer sp. 2205BS26-8]
MKKLRMGMVGGGSGAFIGEIHRIAAAVSQDIQLVCGSFSSDRERTLQTGRLLDLDADRCYGSYDEMFARESSLPKDIRMELVAVVTPNHLHFPVARAALEHGFHVISDKPATLNLQEAIRLKEIIAKNNCLYALTHVYTGYPLVKQARHLVERGELGNIVKVVAEYSQGWLATKASESSKQAAWRLDPARSGRSCCIGDIGVHAANLIEYISGLKITALCADISTVVEGRTLDDDGTVFLRFDNGAKGVLLASQISVGDENNLRLRIYGDKKSIEWSQLDPNTLWLRSNSEPTQQIRTGVGEMSPAATRAAYAPAGHTEGYLEAFANIYKNFSAQIRAQRDARGCDNKSFDVPGIEEAIRGMAFIEKTMDAGQSSLNWMPFSLTAEMSEDVAGE